jgi:hypothetical protein
VNVANVHTLSFALLSLPLIHRLCHGTPPLTSFLSSFAFFLSIFLFIHPSPLFLFLLIFPHFSLSFCSFNAPQHQPDKHLRLFCVVDDATTFPVEIESTETIGDLKDLIKTRKANTFSDVDADERTLWRVSIPDDLDDDDEEERTRTCPFISTIYPAKTGRSSRQHANSDIFNENPTIRMIHFIIHRQPKSNADAPRFH